MDDGKESIGITVWGKRLDGCEKKPWFVRFPVQKMIDIPAGFSTWNC